MSLRWFKREIQSKPNVETKNRKMTMCGQIHIKNARIVNNAKFFVYSIPFCLNLKTIRAALVTVNVIKQHMLANIARLAVSMKNESAHIGASCSHDP